MTPELDGGQVGGPGHEPSLQAHVPGNCQLEKWRYSAIDPLQEMAARDGVLFGQCIEQVEGVLVIEAPGPRVPTQEPYPLPLTTSVVVPPGTLTSQWTTGQTAKPPGERGRPASETPGFPYCPPPARVSR